MFRLWPNNHNQRRIVKSVFENQSEEKPVLILKWTTFLVMFCKVSFTPAVTSCEQPTSVLGFVQCKYIRFRWQLFPNICSFGTDMTRASRLLHKCRENATICLLKLVVVDCCLVSINVATRVSLVNIRLLPFSTTDNINFLRYSFI